MTKKLIILGAILLMSICNLNSYKDVTVKEIKQELNHWDIFVNALIQVESEGIEDAVGTKNCVGVLQINSVFVKDVNRIIGEKKYTLSNRTSKVKSLEMFEILQNHYNPDKDIEKAIKLHNPRAPKSYRNKIMNQIELMVKMIRKQRQSY